MDARSWKTWTLIADAGALMLTCVLTAIMISSSDSGGDDRVSRLVNYVAKPRPWSFRVFAATQMQTSNTEQATSGSALGLAT